MNDKWLDDIRHSLTSFEQDPPPGLLEAIESRHKASRRRRPLLWPWLAAACSAAAVEAVILLYPHHPVTDMTLHPVAQAPAAQQDMRQDARPDAPAAAAAPAAAPLAALRHSEPAQSVAPEEAEPALVTTDDTAADESAAPEQKAEQKAEHEPAPKSKLSDRSDRSDKSDKFSQPRPARSRGAFTLSAYSAGGFGSGSSSALPHASLFSTTKQWLFADHVIENRPHIGTLSSTGQPFPDDINMRHHLPLRFGLAVGYALTPRLTVESGLVYSRLASDIKSNDLSRNYTGRQTLHYLGLPLALRYRILSWRSFQLYAAAGTMAEKLISGHRTGHFTSEGTHTPDQTVSLQEKSLQWSVNLSAGVQYGITRSIALYAEPGMSYRFDNHSEVRNIYKIGRAHV